MLSALIGTEHSYPALLLAEQLADQRFVHPGPLVLGTTLLKFQRPHQIWTNLSHACFQLLLVALDWIFDSKSRLTYSLYGRLVISLRRGGITNSSGRRLGRLLPYQLADQIRPREAFLNSYSPPRRNYQTSLGIVLIYRSVFYVAVVSHQRELGFHRNKLTIPRYVAVSGRRVCDVFCLGIQTVQKPNNPFLFQFRC